MSGSVQTCLAMAHEWGWLDRFREPEYTGENRCTPCTVVNTVLAVLGGAGIGAVTAVAVGSASVAAAVAGVSLAAAALSIYLRGYLVPGTPTLTKRYLPARVLERVDNAPDTAAEPPADINPETVLLDAGALAECDDGSDLCVTAAFRQEWRAEMERLADDEGQRDVLVEILDIGGDSEFVDHGAAVQLHVDGRTVGTWESHAAVLADAAAATTLAESDSTWTGRPPAQRATVLTGLRLFLETCPSCEERLTFGEQTVESCCSRHEIYALECGGCGARLFESRPQ